MNELYKSFISRCNVYQHKVDSLRISRPSMDEWTFNRLTEGLMSDIWQHWCHFCRKLIHNSCRGSICLDRKIVSPRLISLDNSWERLGYEAKRRNQHKTINGHHSFLVRNEPTWGDIDNIVDIIIALDPTNKNQLLSAFGMSLKDINHLQLARNAAAHKNVETMSNLSHDMILYYNFTQLKNPSDLAWSIRQGTTSLAFYVWIYQMKTIAYHAVRTC
ncbi:hypothetical protein [Kosakonia sp. R1.Fl]|uniref:hypothetical protein n=1 Tax=Kosakonia sp. R1.Fl TaxID=2928706 RepID=UPI00201DCFA6|nr:hypothetical protein [Kosakonia sp. R1.Fl]MCL6744449.1 hypothetical protein [Kosakonia sp. R1.Fl]